MVLNRIEVSIDDMWVVLLKVLTLVLRSIMFMNYVGILFYFKEINVVKVHIYRRKGQP